MKHVLSSHLFSPYTPSYCTLLLLHLLCLRSIKLVFHSHKHMNAHLKLLAVGCDLNFAVSVEPFMDLKNCCQTWCHLRHSTLIQTGNKCYFSCAVSLQELILNKGVISMLTLLFKRASSPERSSFCFSGLKSIVPAICIALHRWRTQQFIK